MTPGPMHFAPLEVKTMLNPVKTPAMPFDWSINPYRGCQHGCSFCYARSTHAFLGLDADDTFQRHILYKSNAREALERQLMQLKARRRGNGLPASVAIGTATDPYQPVEAKARLTRACLEVLHAYGVPVSITTRSPLILRDLDLLKQMKGSSVNISLNTLDAALWRNFEPATPSPQKRLEAIGRLTEEGIETTVFMAPILPLLTDDEQGMEQVVRAAAEAGAKQVMGSVLRLQAQAVKASFFQTLTRRYPRLTAPYARLYANGAYAPDLYRREVRERLDKLLKRYGLPLYDPYMTGQNGKPHAEYEKAPMSGDGRLPLEDACSGAGDAPVQLTFSFE